jgi:hypothetical protein
MLVALGLFLLSPITLFAWAAGQLLLRVTGIRWWKLALAIPTGLLAAALNLAGRRQAIDPNSPPLRPRSWGAVVGPGRPASRRRRQSSPRLSPSEVRRRRQALQPTLKLRVSSRLDDVTRAPRRHALSRGEQC